MSAYHNISTAREYVALQEHSNELAQKLNLMTQAYELMKADRDRLKDEVEMLSIDLGVKK